MTDKEMLEYAAKAAGLRVGFEPDRKERGRYDLYWSRVHSQLVWHNKSTGSEYPEPLFWNPLTADGDALRLAVRLGLHARQFPIIADGFDAPLGMVEVWRVDGDDPMHVEFLRSGDDRLVATRRAIVRAAAEIGRGVARPVNDALPEDNYYKSMAEAEEAGRAAIAKAEEGK